MDTGYSIRGGCLSDRRNLFSVPSFLLLLLATTTSSSYSSSLQSSTLAGGGAAAGSKSFRLPPTINDPRLGILLRVKLLRQSTQVLFLVRHAATPWRLWQLST